VRSEMGLMFGDIDLAQVEDRKASQDRHTGPPKELVRTTVDQQVADIEIYWYI